MLVIRHSQMKAFEEDQLCRWIARYLRSCYPDSVAFEGAFHENVVSAIKQARSRGLTAAFEIRKYVHVDFLSCWTLELSEDFRWARDILADEELGAAGDRVRQVESRLLT